MEFEHLLIGNDCGFVVVTPYNYPRMLGINCIRGYREWRLWMKISVVGYGACLGIGGDVHLHVGDVGENHLEVAFHPVAVGVVFYIGILKVEGGAFRRGSCLREPDP